MGEQTTSTSGNTEQVREPWGPAQPHLQNIMNAGRTYYGQGVGSDVWQGPDVAPLNNQLSGALTDIWNTSHRNTSSPEDVYRSSLNQINSNGVTPGMQPGMNILNNFAGGNFSNDTRFDNIYEGVGPSAAQTYLTGQASGLPMSASETNLSGMAAGGGTNPFLQTMLDQGAQRIRDQVNSSMSGSGRYGSFGHAGALNDRIAEFQNPVLSQAYEADRNRMLQASGQIDAAREAARAGQRAATGQIDAATQAGNQTRLAAEQGWQGVNQANDQMRMAGATGLLQNLQAGAQRGLAYSAMAPQLYDAMYAPARQRAAVGDYMQGRDQQSLQGAIDRFNAEEQMPWRLLGNYGAALGYTAPLASGAGTLSGTTNQTQTRPYGFMDYANLFQGGSNSAASGAALAAALPFMLSDRDEKTDIKKVGDSKTTGLPLYSYRYRGDPKTYPKVIGPMAQDIEKHFPGSTTRVDGKMVVKPQAAGLLGAL